MTHHDRELAMKDREIQTLQQIIESLKVDNALQADVIQGFLSCRMHAAFDIRTQQHMLSLMFDEKALVCGRRVAESVGARVAYQLDKYIKKLGK